MASTIISATRAISAYARTADLRELRNLWLFGAVAAVAGFLILQTMLGWSWDAWTIGFVLFGIGWIAFQWWRRYPHG